MGKHARENAPELARVKDIEDLARSLDYALTRLGSALTTKESNVRKAIRDLQDEYNELRSLDHE
jgi:hypothetical protein